MFSRTKIRKLDAWELNLNKRQEFNYLGLHFNWTTGDNIYNLKYKIFNSNFLNKDYSRDP